MSKLGVFGSAQATSDRYRRRLLAAAGLSNNLLNWHLNGINGLNRRSTRLILKIAGLSHHFPWITMVNNHRHIDCN